MSSRHWTIPPGRLIAPGRARAYIQTVTAAVRIGTLVVGAGGFHLGAKDVLHETIVSVDGALPYLRGPVPTEALAI